MYQVTYSAGDFVHISMAFETLGEAEIYKKLLLEEGYQNVILEEFKL